MYQMFNIDFKKLAVLLIPTFLREPKHIAFVECFINPITEIQREFLDLRAKDIYKLNHTPQVCSLERMLNDHFDISQRRIRIGEVLSNEPFFIFKESENTPKYIDETNIIYLNRYSANAGNGNEFTVYLPYDIWNEQKTEVELGEYRYYRIEALLDFYKLAGKKYKIVLNG